ncbi:MAG: helix-turn-helix domain-containing protein [Acidobacteriaceae bacterium]
MKKENRENKAAHRTTGSVFDDLGLGPGEALEAKIKTEIFRALVDCIEARALTQAELVKLLKAHQPDVSNLLHGKISKFSVGKLIQFAARLDLHAEVKISAPKTVRTIQASTVTTKNSRELARAR